MNGMETEKHVFEIIQESLKGKKYGNDTFELITEPEFKGYKPDLLIKARKKIIATIEIKTSSTLTKVLSSFTTEYYLKFKTRYFVYTDGSTFYVFDRLINPEKSVKTDLSGFVTRITRQISKDRLRILKKEVSSIFEKVINKYIDQYPDLLEFVKESRAKISRELRLDSKYNFYFIGSTTDISSFEHEFFLRLLGACRTL